MTLKPINFSTGPVEIRKEVFEAMGKTPVSHRSPKFIKYFNSTVDNFKDSLNVKDIFILTGSGTLANEAMLWQIKAIKGKGLVLSNGEFGKRLRKQAKRINLKFESIKKNWGEEFDLEEIEKKIKTKKLDWILFPHCETSTGVVNDLESICNIAKKHKCKVYVDCMSSIGTMPLNLEGVELATASSGKGLGSFAGLALIFSNSEIKKHKKIPRYLDLNIYKTKGIPFTISSNLIEALSISIGFNLSNSKYERISKQAEVIYNQLNETNLIPFAKKGTRVFTITPNTNAEEIYYKLSEQGLTLSCQSSYLIKRNWLQVALFGNYEDNDIIKLCNLLKIELMELTE